MIKKRCVTEYANHQITAVERMSIPEEKKLILQRMIVRAHRWFESGYISIDEAMLRLSEIGMYPEETASKYLG